MKGDLCGKAAKGIVKARYALLALFAVLAVLGVLGTRLTKVNNDITAYLPASTDTARGVGIMAEEFPSLSSGGIKGDYNDTLMKEMAGVLLAAFAVILAVLLLTSSSFFDIAVYFPVFLAAAAINMGSYFLMGTISAITNTVAVILQLALSIDYAIIFMHIYREERDRADSAVPAAEKALARAAREILSSSLTTVSGLSALVLMQFRFGADLGLALVKGVVCSMLTVFLLMPSLVTLSDRLLSKTRHRSFIPDVTRLAAGPVKARKALAVIFLCVLVPFAVFSFRAEFAFSGTSVTPVTGETEESGSTGSVLAVIVPAGSDEAQTAFVNRAYALPGADNAIAWSSLLRTAAENGLIAGDPEKMPSLSEPLSAEEMGALVGADPGTVQLLYRLIALDRGDLSGALAPAQVKASAEEAIRSLKARRDMLPEGELRDKLLAAEQVLDTAEAQLRGREHDRVLVFTSFMPDSRDAEALLLSLKSLAEECFGEGKTLICGDITSAYELKQSFVSDSVRVNLLSALFVFVILLLTYRRFLPALISVLVIQSSVWINFGCTFLAGDHPLFVTQMIGTAIQIGATVDYAIVVTGRYLAFRKENRAPEAAALAVGSGFSTVMTSGLIMTAAGLLIAFMISDPYVGHIGLAVGRGALISAVLVLCVLPGLLVMTDRKKDLRPDGK